jgi:uncharacterized protein DUF3800
MAGYRTVTTFFDASGKPKDHKVIVFGGVAAYNEFFNPFAEEWGRLLYRNGLQVLTAKDAFNSRRPLSRKNDRCGIDARIEDLLPFIACIRKYLQVVTSVAVDVGAFRKLPDHFFRSYGNDPIFVAFARTLLRVLEFTPDKDKIGFTCDDDEELAVHLFRLYRKVKRVFPEARKKMVAVTFGDDKTLFGLQAADFVAGIMRLEAGRRLFRVKYDYQRLFKALVKNPDHEPENIWEVSTAFADKRTLINTSNSLDAKRKEMLEEEARRQK